MSYLGNGMGQKKGKNPKSGPAEVRSSTEGRGGGRGTGLRGEQKGRSGCLG